MTVASERLNATAALAQHAAGLRFEALPGATVEHAKAALLDVIGIALRGGSDSESSQPIRSAVDDLDAGGHARVIGSDRGYQVQYAALLNATFAHTLDFDDTHVGGSIHPGAPTIPAVLAVAEAGGRNGRDVLAAIVAGYDVVVRLSEELTPAAQYERGFHPTATCGTFGVAAAVGNLAGDSAATLERAFGIALSQAAGSMQFLENGSWNKRFHVGFAAYNGIVAERFARAGVIGAAAPFEGRFGFHHAYAGGSSFSGLERRLNGGHAIDETAFKPYPSCRYTHAALDELIELRQSGAFEAGAIESVTIALPRVSFALVKDPEPQKRAALSVVDRQFSMVFLAAVALLRGRFGWDDYRIGDDAEVRAMIERISIVDDPEIEALGQSMAARVVVRAGGKTHERFSPGPKGEPDRPLSWDDVIAKFDGLASSYDAPRRARVVDAVRRLDACPDVRELTALLGA